MKKFLLVNIFSLLLVIGAYAQNPTYDIFYGATNNLSFSWQNNFNCDGCSDAIPVVTTGTPYEGNDHLLFDYYMTAWWAGGAFNVNAWGGSPQDWSGYTHMGLAWKGTADYTTNKLTFVLNDPSLNAGNSVDVALNSNTSNYTTNTIALSDFVGGSLADLTDIEGIAFGVTPTGASGGVTYGQFYIDAIRLYDYTAPTVTSFSPASAMVGDVVTITGTFLANVNSVSFNGTSTTNITNVTSTSFDVVVPVGATDGTITVSNPVNSGASSSSFTVVAPPAPTITSFSPASGMVGDVITITGTDLLGTTDVSFNGTSAITISNITATSLDVVVPVGATDGTISVTTSGGTGTSSVSFDVTVATSTFSKNAIIDFSISPNPSSGMYLISSEEVIDAITVRNQQGKVVVSTNSSQIDLTSQPDGLYFMTVTSGEKVTTKKLVKNK